MALHHAADADDGPAGAVLLESARFNERVDRLLLRGVDEAARIHDNDLGLREIGREFRAGIRELSYIALTVDGVFVAAEREEGELQRSYWLRCWMLCARELKSCHRGRRRSIKRGSRAPSGSPSPVVAELQLHPEIRALEELNRALQVVS